MKKTLIVLGSIFGALLLLCCGGVAVLYFFVDGNAYAQPADVCKTSSVASLSRFGTAGDRQHKDVTAYGRTFGSCVITLDSDGTSRTLTVVLDAPSDTSDTRAHYDNTKAFADKAVAGGAKVEDVDLGNKAFVMYLTANGELMVELDFYHGNLYVSLNIRGPAVSLTAAQAKPSLVAMGKDLMAALDTGGSGSGHDWDD